MYLPATRTAASVTPKHAAFWKPWCRYVEAAWLCTNCPWRHANTCYLHSIHKSWAYPSESSLFYIWITQDTTAAGKVCCFYPSPRLAASNVCIGHSVYWHSIYSSTEFICMFARIQPTFYKLWTWPCCCLPAPAAADMYAAGLLISDQSKQWVQWWKKNFTCCTSNKWWVQSYRPWPSAIAILCTCGSSIVYFVQQVNLVHNKKQHSSLCTMICRTLNLDKQPKPRTQIHWLAAHPGASCLQLQAVSGLCYISAQSTDWMMTCTCQIASQGIVTKSHLQVTHCHCVFVCLVHVLVVYSLAMTHSTSIHAQKWQACKRH